MKKFLTPIPVVIGLIFSLFIVGTALATHIPTNGDFETGDLTGWSVFTNPGPERHRGFVFLGCRLMAGQRTLDPRTGVRPLPPQPV